MGIEVGEGDLVEMVLIPEGKRATLRVSSQGCAVDCVCATGNKDFLEIYQQQKSLVKFGLRKPLRNLEITVQKCNKCCDDGHGEPLLISNLSQKL